MYDGIHLHPTCKMNYVKMQHTYKCFLDVLRNHNYYICFQGRGPAIYDECRKKKKRFTELFVVSTAITRAGEEGQRG